MTGQRDIFITGSHRSGSSWVAKMIAPSGDFLIRDEEIFNGAGEIAKHPFPWMYPYVCAENEARFYPYVKGVVEKKYSLLGGLQKVRAPKDLLRVAKRKLRSVARRLDGNRPQIFVEPIGLFSTEWFARRFQTQVVVVIRHPASFVSSLKRLNWGFNFSHLLEQGLLMDRFFLPFKKELENPPRRPDLIGIGILQWKILYSVIDRFRQEHPDWIFVRHEDLASDPIGKFRAMYQALGLEFREESEKVIHLHTSSDNPAEFDGRRDRSRRNSLETVQIWKKRLAPEEIRRIREGVEEVSRQFYGEESWS
jgi:hypothetical protein